MILRARIVMPISRAPIENGAVRIEERRIQEVGRWADLRHAPSQAVEDLGEVVLLPGLINAHCHLDYTAMAGLLPPPKSFADWIRSLVSLKAQWTEEDYATSWELGARMLLANGVTTVADIESVPTLIPSLWEKTPLRVISFLELIGLKDDETSHQRIRKAIAAWARLPHERVGLSPHAPYTTTPGLLRQAAAKAEASRWPLTMHVAESEEEFLMFTERRGALFDWLRIQRDVSDCGHGSPVAFLDRLGVMSPRLTAVHVNYLARGDAELLSQRGVSVVHCPRSHAYFGHAPFPLAALEKRGVTVCLGTDSLASVRCAPNTEVRLDLRAEMQLLHGQTAGPSPEAILRMATVNPAKALGFTGQIGELAPGTFADLLALPFEGPVGKAAEGAIEYSGPPHGVMILGEWAVVPHG